MKKKKELDASGVRVHARETRSSIPPKRRAAAAAASTLITHKKKLPSAASIVARRKTRMATLQAVTKDMSKRMLTRLTPRGTSNANFLKTIRTKPLNSGHSLRGRDVSVSTDEEEEIEVDEESFRSDLERDSIHGSMYERPLRSSMEMKYVQIKFKKK